MSEKNLSSQLPLSIFMSQKASSHCVFLILCQQFYCEQLLLINQKHTVAKHPTQSLRKSLIFMSDFKMEKNIAQHIEVLSVMTLLQAVAVKELSQKAKLLINRVCSTGRRSPSQVQNILNGLHSVHPLLVSWTCFLLQLSLG